MDVSTPDRDDFQKDPLFALFSEHRRKLEAEDGGGATRTDSPVDVERLNRQELIGLLNEETRANAAWTVFFHSAIAHSLGLHTSDHKCLDLIWQAEFASAGEYDRLYRQWSDSPAFAEWANDFRGAIVSNVHAILEIVPLGTQTASRKT